MGSARNASSAGLAGSAGSAGSAGFVGSGGFGRFVRFGNENLTYRGFQKEQSRTYFGNTEGGRLTTSHSLCLNPIGLRPHAAGPLGSENGRFNVKFECAARKS